MYICVRCLHWGIYAGSFVTVAQEVSLFPSTAWGQVPCPAMWRAVQWFSLPSRGWGGPLVEQDLTGDCTYGHFISSCPCHQHDTVPSPDPASGVADAWAAWRRSEPQSMGGEDANSSVVVWWETEICVPWKSVPDQNLKFWVKKSARFWKFWGNKNSRDISSQHGSRYQYCSMALFQEGKILLCYSIHCNIKQEKLHIR